MSIEQDIQANTQSLGRVAASIEALTAALRSGAFSAVGATLAINNTAAVLDKVSTTGTVDGEDEPVTVAKAGPEGGPDKRGFTWDERIHASTKRLNSDGTYTYRKNVDKALVAQVEAELKGESQEGDDEPEEKATTKSTQTKKQPSFDDEDDDFGASGEDEDDLGGTPGFSLEDVASAFEEITSYAKHEKRLGLLLEQFDIEEYTDLAPADYAAFVEEANKHIGFFKISAKAQEMASTSLGRDAVVKLIGKFKNADGDKATMLSHIQFADYDKFMVQAKKMLDTVE